MKKISTLLVLALLPFLLSAQGTISGTIIDEKYGDPLIGANIVLEGTSTGASTDFDGKYSFDIPAGTYNIVMSYIGYIDKTIEGVVIKDGEITYLDGSLSDQAQELGEVIVKAKVIERSENALLMLQKKSELIQDGISSQEMSRMAVGNAAKAMGKVTGTSVVDGKYVYVRGLGDRYSIAQLNGLMLPSIDPYRNSVQLDLIPTSLLDNIITAKTFTPDQPGTFTGGNLNIKTKSLPEREIFKVSLSTQYNPQNNFIDNFLTYDDGVKNDWIGYGGKERQRPSFLSEENIASYLNQNAELKAFTGDAEAAEAIDRVANAFDYNFAPIQKSTPIDHGISTSYGNSYNIGSGKLGLILAGGFKRGFTHFEDAITQRWILFNSNSDVLDNRGDYLQDRSAETAVVNALGGLAYKFDDFNTIDFKVLYNHNTEKGARYSNGEDGNNIEAPFFKLGRTLKYMEREMLNYQLTGIHVIPKLKETKIEWGGSFVKAKLDQPNLRYFNSQLNSERGTEGLPLSNVNDPLYFWRDLQDNIVNFKTDITVPFSKALKLKFGGYYSAKDRDFNEYRYNTTASPNAARFNGDFGAFYGEENVGIIGEKERSGKTRYLIGNFITDQTNADNSYTGTEDVIAAYAQVSVIAGEKLKFVGGARLETTDIFVKSKNEAKEDEDRIGEIDRTNILPSLNAIYSISENINLRASFTHTIARPNLREIAPFSVFDPDINEFIIGNPELEQTDIENADLRLEYFMNPGEVIAISGFYKNFKNPIAMQYLNASNLERQFTNVESGLIYGLEFELRKNLGFIADALSDFKFSSNFAFITSKMDVIVQTGLEPDSRPFEGQAPFIGNANLSYNDTESNFDVTLSYNYTGDRLAFIGLEIPDIYDRARHTLDLSARKKFGKVGISLSAKNLLNPDFILSNSYKGSDFLFSKYKRRIGMGLGLSYDIK